MKEKSDNKNFLTGMEQGSERKQRPIPEGLTKEEIVVWHEVNEILDRYGISIKTLSTEKIDEMLKKKFDFKKELKDKGIEPQEYILWHRVVGSTLPIAGVTKFDTLNHDIENFVRTQY